MQPVTSHNTRETQDNANVVMLPPLVFLFPLVLAVLLRYLVVSLFIFHHDLIRHLAGWLLIAVALIVIAGAMRAMGNVHEDADPRTPTNHIVLTGPYKFTRNPMYLSMFLVYFGITILINSWWPVIFLPIVLLVIHYGVIFREERYLERKLGEEYLSYKSRVRRWL